MYIYMFMFRLENLARKGLRPVNLGCFIGKYTGRELRSGVKCIVVTIVTGSL